MLILGLFIGVVLGWLVCSIITVGAWADERLERSVSARADGDDDIRARWMTEE